MDLCISCGAGDKTLSTSETSILLLGCVFSTIFFFDTGSSYVAQVNFELVMWPRLA